MKITFSTILMILGLSLQAQNTMTDTIPYSIIPEAATDYTAGTVIARMIDGLGFRYHWATEGLRQEDLAYAPGNDGRTIEQTIDHIYTLSEMILNAAKKLPNDRTAVKEKLSTTQQRIKTLNNLKEASALFVASTDMKAHNIVFKSEKGEAAFPLWNGINGPIEDAIWHAGQIVVLRRAAGNPINPKVNVFLGNLNE